MTASLRTRFLFGFLCCMLMLPSMLSAQLQPIGQWRVHIPYSNPIALADAGDRVYVANELSAYTFFKEDGSFRRLSKVNTLSDIGMRNLFYSDEKDALVLAYTNSNIDILFGENSSSGESLFNFPFIKNQNIVGDKSIYDAAFLGDSMYLACGFGVVVVDLEKRESPATYFFNDPLGSPIRVNAVLPFGGYLFAATEQGLYRGELSNPLLEDFASWELAADLPVGDIDLLVADEARLYAQVDSVIYAADLSGWFPWYSVPGGNTIFGSYNPLTNYLVFITRSGMGEAPDDFTMPVFEDQVLVSSINLVDGPPVVAPLQFDTDPSGDIWIADLFRGLTRLTPDGIYETVNPNGPATSKVTNMMASGGRLMVAPGEVNGSWNRLFNRSGFYEFSGDVWKNYNGFEYGPLDTVADVLAVTINPQNGHFFFGSFGEGMMELTADDQLLAYEEGTTIAAAVGDPSNHRVGGLAFDQNGNLWIANHGSATPIALRTAGGEWYGFDPALSASVGNQLAQTLVDDFGQVWFVLPRGNGILVYDPGQDITSPVDDRSERQTLAAGSGGLHTTEILCLAKDLDGEIWVGTEEGITVYYNPFAVLEPGTVAGDAAQIFVTLDGFGSFLLDEEQVNAIAVDGANRKWLGTNNGVFLVSEDGTEQLAYFNEENSPLLSNEVLSIAIDELTGEVFFGTNRGIISYRGAATGGVFEHSEVIVFPNPVRENYDGPIAIKGLVQDADVKITDVAGELVYATQALGGQAIWNGRRLDGKRASSGVYLVFSSSADGTETFVAKFLLMN